MSFFFRNSTPRDPLAVTMSGVRMGERVLQIGVDDPRVVGAITAKVGLSGHAAIAVADEPSADRARSGAAEAGGLLDLHVTALGALPFDPGSFDAVVVHNVDGLLPSLGGTASMALAECRRVLRDGGRIVVIERGTPTGMATWFGGQKNPAAASAVTEAALAAAGFRPVRALADREGLQFVEGLKT